MTTVRCVPVLYCSVVYAVDHIVASSPSNNTRKIMYLDLCVK